MDIENPMVIDALWPDDEREEDKWEDFCRRADEEYDSRIGTVQEMDGWMARQKTPEY